MSTARARPTPPEPSWWLRVLLVLQAPTAVFAALRDDSPEEAGERQEPVLGITLLAGMALALASTQAGRLLNDPEYDPLLIVVWVFIAGGVVGAINLWLGGWVLYLALRGLDGLGSYRRARHLLAFAATPLTLMLLLWPVRLALYGGDSFRRGGEDAGTGARAFEVLEVGFGLWALALLFLGVRTVHGWSWGRSAAAFALAAAAAAALVVVFSLFG